MMRYVALLRGINVGAVNRIRMDELKRVFANAGFTDVETYIQSGNVVFSSDLPEEDAREKIRLALENDAGIHTVVVLRSADELAEIRRQIPFSSEEIAAAQAANTEGESFHVCLLPAPPAAAALASLASVPLDGRRVRRRRAGRISAFVQEHPPVQAGNPRAEGIGWRDRAQLEYHFKARILLSTKRRNR